MSELIQKLEKLRVIHRVGGDTWLKNHFYIRGCARDAHAADKVVRDWRVAGNLISLCAEKWLQINTGAFGKQHNVEVTRYDFDLVDHIELGEAHSADIVEAFIEACANALTSDPLRTRS